MDWKKEAIDKLRQYEAKKQCVKIIPEEIKRLELEMANIRSATGDGTPMPGGGSRREDMLLNNIVLREELERTLEQAKIWVKEVDGGMEILNQTERQVLDRFFVHPEIGAADRLAGELGLDVKTVYRRRDSALRRFTVSLYGAVEN